MASSAFAEWRVEQLTNPKTDCAFRFAALVAIGVLVIGPMAHADPVYMACTGQMLLPNKKVDMNATLSLAIDLRAGAVTVGGYQPVGLVPAIPAAPGIPNAESNMVVFFGATSQGVLSGRVDRITGEASVHFSPDTPQDQFFDGVCKTTQKLF
jgi:hypothetical protein